MEFDHKPRMLQNSLPKSFRWFCEQDNGVEGADLMVVGHRHSVQVKTLNDRTFSPKAGQCLYPSGERIRPVNCR